MEKNAKKIVLNIILVLITIASTVCLGIFSYNLIKLNIIPNKYLTMGYTVLAILLIILLFLMFSKRKVVTKIISTIILIILAVASIIVSGYLKTTNSFFENTNKDYDTLTYSVVVLKDNTYDNIIDLNNKKISYLNDNYSEDIKNYLDSRIDFEEEKLDEANLISESLLNQSVDAIVLEESYLILLNEEEEDFESNTKVIATFEIRVKTYQEEATKLDVVNDAFILYISGIDQYGNVNSVRGRSDVNQIAVVNPKTNHILLVNTPRDFYVQLDGTTGLRDKLTHAGIYGIDKSIKTLENFYNIDIDHYLRVNFNTLIQIVDVIGGIDIYSDKSFVAHTNRNVTINEGWNYLNGEQALAYSRERYAYLTGDRHRGENQQQVITAIINKISSSKVLVSKYNSILNVLEGSFQTDMSPNLITSFIKYQLNEMPSWNVESISVTGSDSSNYTYSMGTRYKLYVMEPDMNSVNTAISKMHGVLNEE